MEKTCLKCYLLTLLTMVNAIVQTLGSEFYADNGLQQTIVIGHTSEQRKAEMQQEILELLGLHQRPKPAGHGFENSAPQFMIQLYNTLQSEEGNGITDDDDNVFHSKVNITFGNNVEHINGTDVIMSFVNHANKIPHLRHDKDNTFFFDTSDVAADEGVTSAQFRLYKEPGRKSRAKECLIELFRISQGVDPEDKSLEPETNMTVDWDYEGWLSFNVTHAMYLWTGLPYTNLGLYMRVTYVEKGRTIDPGKFGIVGRKGPEELQAFMVGFFQTGRNLHLRRTRSAKQRQNSTPNEAENYYHWGGGDSYSVDNYRKRACQKHTMYVNFRSLGWQDWIIAPEGYAAFYCGGECTFPLGSHMNATNHAIVQTLVHLTKPYAVPKPCCAPTKLSAIQVLYFDEKSNVVLKRYKHMVVKTCGCH